MSTFATTTKRPDVHEMLTDPDVRAVMTRDGVTRQDVVGAIAAARLRRTPRRPGSRRGPGPEFKTTET